MVHRKNETPYEKSNHTSVISSWCTFKGLFMGALIQYLRYLNSATNGYAMRLSAASVVNQQRGTCMHSRCIQTNGSSH